MSGVEPNETAAGAADPYNTDHRFEAQDGFVGTGYNSSDGFVSVEFHFSTVSPSPLPASALMFGAAGLALSFVGCGVKRKKKAAAA